MGRSTTAQLKDKDRHVTVPAHESDAPLLPMAQIERLNEICPERVPWVFDETSRESEFRRVETRRLNTLAFTERIAGVVAGLVIACVSLFTSYHVAINGHDMVAAVIGGTTVVGLVSAFVIGARKRQPPNQGRWPRPNSTPATPEARTTRAFLRLGGSSPKN